MRRLGEVAATAFMYGSFVFAAVSLGAHLGARSALVRLERAHTATCHGAPAPAELEIACPQLREHVERLESAEGFRERLRGALGKVK